MKIQLVKVRFQVSRISHSGDITGPRAY